MSEEEQKAIEKRKYIKAWEQEAQQWLDKGDVISATMCELLAENLRKEIGESKYE